jgi:serine/threonine-protein kinase
VAATSVEIDTPEAGWTAEIHVAPDGDAPNGAPGEGEWQEVGGGTVKRKRQRFTLRTEGKAYRYYLVWITKLPEGAERVEIADVSLFARRRT